MLCCVVLCCVVTKQIGFGLWAKQFSTFKWHQSHIIHKEFSLFFFFISIFYSKSDSIRFCSISGIVLRKMTKDAHNISFPHTNSICYLLIMSSGVSVLLCFQHILVTYLKVFTVGFFFLFHSVSRSFRLKKKNVLFALCGICPESFVKTSQTIVVKIWSQSLMRKKKNCQTLVFRPAEILNIILSK